MNKQTVIFQTIYCIGLLLMGGMILCAPFDCAADTPQQNIVEVNQTQTQEVTLADLRKKTEEFLKNSESIAVRIDEVLADLLTIPEHKRQYFFPYLHEETLMPHKIKSHPQIIVWKGKRPTVIAPQMQEFAEKYLDDLPAAFYYFMDPDMYAQPQPIENTINTDLLNTNMPQMKTKSVLEIANYAVRDIKESYILSDETQKNFYNPTTNEGEVNRFIQTLPSLIRFVDTYPDNDNIPMILRHLIGSDVSLAMAKPFELWVKNIRLTKADKDFETFIQKQGWKNADEFAEKGDKILRAARASRMTLVQAISYSHLRKLHPVEKNKPMTAEQLYWLMYEAHPGDALFLAKYTENMKKILDENNFVRIGLLVDID